MLKIDKYNFVIFGHARSGTSRLANIFKRNGVSLLGEPFNINCITDIYKKQLKSIPFENVLDNIANDYVGFKHLLYDLNKDMNDIILNRFKTIFLYRDNLLNASISYQLAIKTKVWSKETSTENYLNNPVYLNPKDIKKTIAEISESLNYYKKNSKNCMFISYEKLYESNDNAKREIIESIFNYVSAKIKDWEVTLNLLSDKYKLNKLPWSETIRNWEELRNIKYK